MSIPLKVVPRASFSSDPCFDDCWDDIDKERKLACLREKAIKEKCESPNKYVNIPWKWDKMGRMREFIRGPPDLDKSEDVDATTGNYKVLLDVQHFATLKNLEITLTDRTITITGTHEEMQDGEETVSRSFTRKYTLPSDTVMEKVECNLSSDGVLHITAPREQASLKKQDIANNFGGAVKGTVAALSSWVKQFSVEVEEGLEAVAVGNIESRKPKVAVYADDLKPSIWTIPDFNMVPFWEREVQPDKSRFGNKSDKNNFKVVVDVRQFHAKELTAYKTRDYILIEGKHDEKEDEHGSIARDFTRKFWLPRGVEADEVICYLTTDGVLELKAPKSCRRASLAEEIPVKISILSKDDFVGQDKSLHDEDSIC